MIGKGRPRAFRSGNGIRMHTPEKTARYENLVAMVAQQAMRGRAAMTGAVRKRYGEAAMTIVWAQEIEPDEK